MNSVTGVARAILAVALLCAGPVIAAPETKGAPAEGLRPPADILEPCDKLPKAAVTRLPPDLSRWATVYCTKFGQIFNANDTHFGAFPDNGARATFSAGTIDGKSGADAAGSYFTSIAYVDFTPQELQALVKIDPISAKIVNGRPSKKLDLATNGGKALTFLVIDPSADPFWVFPLTDKGLGSPAFFVVSSADLKRKP
ncbi:MAG: hypothetical protein KGM42_10145 [Hyphomicrobiales bacterium]|nr:hypothetical protein [Hyphomicrobiales bacterium]